MVTDEWRQMRTRNKCNKWKQTESPWKHKLIEDNSDNYRYIKKKEKKRKEKALDSVYQKPKWITYMAMNKSYIKSIYYNQNDQVVNDPVLEWEISW